MSDRENRIRATGFSKITDVAGKDFPAAILFLQKRWEDAQGNVYAKRVGTMVVHYLQYHRLAQQCYIRDTLWQYYRQPCL